MYIINNNMFFSALCTDREVLYRMNCPPLCIINPTNHVVHLLLVCSENALRAPYHILPCFHDTHLTFSALCSIAGRDGGREISLVDEACQRTTSS